MQIINLDELEETILNYGKKNGYLLDMSTTDDISLTIKSNYLNRRAEIKINGLYAHGCNGMLKVLKFEALEWKDLYYKLWKYFK